MQKLLLRFEKYLLASVILAIPLYPKFPLFSIPKTYVSLRLEDFLILSVILLIFINNIWEIKRLISDKVVMAIGIFLLAGFISYLSAAYITQTIDLKIGLFHLIRRMEYLSMFVAGYLTIRKKPEYLNFFLKLIPIIIFIAFMYGFGQKYFNWPIIITQNEEYSKGIALRYVEGSHINSTFAGHYDLASYLVLFLPFILSLALNSKRVNLFILTVYFSGLWLLVNTASRISFVSFLVAAAVALTLQKQIKKGFILIVASVLFIGFSSNLINRYERVFQIIQSSFNKYVLINIPIASADEPVIMRREVVTTPTPIPPQVFEDRSTSIRLNVEWPRALRAFMKNPLLGTGYSSITLATDNDYLRLLGEVGLIGFLSFFLIFSNLGLPLLGYIRRKVNVNLIENIFIFSFLSGFLGVLMNAFFIDIFEASKFAISFWLFAGILYARVNLKYE